MNYALVSNVASLAVPMLRAAGLGEPYIASYTPAGTVIEWGGNPYHKRGGTALSLEEMRAIANSLLATGLYAAATATKLAGVVSPYYTLRLVTAVDRAALPDVYSDLEEAFAIADVEPTTQQFYVKSVPAQSAGQPGVVAINAGSAPGDGQIAYVTTLPNTGDTNPINTLANWLGVTPTQAAIVGAVGAVVAIVLIKRAV